MSERHYDCSGKNNPRARKVYQFDLNYNFIRYFDTVVEAAKTVGINDMCIHQAIKNNGTSCGYLWAFRDNVVKDANGYRLKNKIILPTKNRNEVFQFDLNGNFIGKYISSNKASKEIKEKYNLTISRESIFGAAKRQGTAGNYQWRFKENVEQVDEEKYSIKEVA